MLGRTKSSAEVPHRWDFSGTSIQGHLSRGLIDVMRLTLLLLVSYRPLATFACGQADLALVRATCGLG